MNMIQMVIVNIIHNFYGDNNLIRFKKNEDLYHALQIDSMHKIYPGNHVSLFKNRETIVDDIVDFIKRIDLEKTRVI